MPITAEEQMMDLTRRVSVLDGNGKDPMGGRMGRAEADVKKIFDKLDRWEIMLIGTLITSVGSLVGIVVQLITRKP